MSFHNCSNSHEHDAVFEEKCQELFIEMQKANSPLTDLLTILDIRWEDLPTLQAQQVAAHFQGVITTAIASGTQPGDPRMYSLANQFFEKADTLNQLRRLLDDDEFQEVA